MLCVVEILEVNLKLDIRGNNHYRNEEIFVGIFALHPCLLRPDFLLLLWTTSLPQVHLQSEQSDLKESDLINVLSKGDNDPAVHQLSLIHI